MVSTKLPIGVLNLTYTKHALKRMLQRKIPKLETVHTNQIRWLDVRRQALRIRYKTYLNMVIKPANDKWLVISIWFTEKFKREQGI